MAVKLISPAFLASSKDNCATFSVNTVVAFRTTSIALANLCTLVTSICILVGRLRSRLRIVTPPGSKADLIRAERRANLPLIPP